MANRNSRLIQAENLASLLHDDDVSAAINQFLQSKWRKPCFAFPDTNPILWFKFANVHGFERIEMEARNQQYIFDAVEAFYQKSCIEQQQLLATVYKDEKAKPPRVRIPRLFRVIRTTDFRALVMEYVPGQTLDWLMRLEYNATKELSYWHPAPQLHRDSNGRLCGYDLSVFEDHLRDYAHAVGLLLSLPVPDDTAPGPVGGGYSNHPIFEDYSTEENRAPLVLPRLPSDAKFADFSSEPLCYVLSDLNNANVMFHDKEIYLIDHLDAGIMPLSFMTIVADLGRIVAKHLMRHLKLPQDNHEVLANVRGAFWPPLDNESDD
ncbi:hypothetical protein ACHAO8_010049 [Botrytis cinerea]